MFTNVATARRIEAAETALTLRFAEAARENGREARVVRIGAGAAVYGGENAPFNKLIGVGFEPLDEDSLARAETEHDERRAPLRAEVSTLVEPPVFEALSRRGYALAGFENVLGMEPRTDVARTAPEVAVHEAEPREYAEWQRVFAEGFAAADGSAPPTESFPREALDAMFRDFARITELRRFVARTHDRTMVGAASSCSFGDVALMTGAATLPAHRRRGVQRALLHERLARVARAGQTLAIVTTQPGSQSNVERAGFALLYARAVLVRAPRQ